MYDPKNAAKSNLSLICWTTSLMPIVYAINFSVPTGRQEFSIKKAPDVHRGAWGIYPLGRFSRSDRQGASLTPSTYRHVALGLRDS